MDVTQDLWSVLTTFSDEAIEVAVAKCEELGLDQNRGPIPLGESIVNLRNLTSLLKESIESRKLIQLPISLQKTLLGQLQSISNALTGMGSGRDEVVNLTTGVENLYASIWQYRINDLTDGRTALKDTENRIKKIEVEGQAIVKELKASLNTRTQVTELVSMLQRTVTESGEALLQMKQRAENSEQLAKEIEQVNASATLALQAIEKTKLSSADLLNAIDSIKKQVDIRDKEFETYRKQVQELSTRADSLFKELEKQVGDSQLQYDSSVKQVETLYSRVESLLPGATSAGLADAFRQRKITIAQSKKWWLIGFVCSIVGLVTVISWVLGSLPSAVDSSEWWRSFAQRIPLTLPFIWAGWFFGRNFGHIMRLEEVYAFKQAASQSFEGYKKQMFDVSPDKSLPKLCDEAIAIFSSSPLHVFDRRTSDETPMNSMYDRVFGRKSELK